MGHITASETATPNHSIERAAYSWLRQLQAASHVKRCAAP